MARRAEGGEYEKKLLGFLEDPTSLPSAAQIRQEPYVVSFCGRPTRSGQWLHYGRSGCGVALCFMRDGFIGEDYDVVKVDYDRDSQRTRLAALIDSVKPVLLELRREASVEVAVATDALAAVYVSFAIENLSSHVKHPSFVEEEEYRLIGSRVIHGRDILGDPDQAKPEFRRSGEALVPYLRVGFKESAFTELVLGYSTVLSVDAARVFLREKGLNPILSRSEVPVR